MSLGDKYDYTKVEYKNTGTKVILICKEHGEFLQTPSEHLVGSGCIDCAGLRKKTTEEFIEDAKLFHGERYDYSEVNYKNKNSLVKIKCPDHGVFEQQAGSHLRGRGCIICSGKNQKERNNLALKALENVGLKDRIHHRPNQLSGGQQQRVSIARAIAGSPKLILADEPTGALDSKTSIEIMTILNNLNAKGITVGLVTHEDDIAKYGSRIIKMKDGQIIEDKKNVPN